MKIRLTRTVRLHTSVLKKTLETLLPHTGQMEFIEDPEPLFFQNDNFRWDEFFISCTEYRNAHNFEEEDFLVVLTELNNESNWFSSFSLEKEKTIFIRATDWENYIYCEPIFPIAYEVIANVLQSISFAKYGQELMNYFHHEPVGCMNDMCNLKLDISYKLRTADICPTCLKMLSDMLDEQYLNQAIDIFEALRKQMVFNTNYQKPLTYEERLPFTIAITKRKLSTTLEPFRKLLMLIDHFDSIVRTAVIMISHISMSKEDISTFFSKNELSKRPSLGHWVNALSKLSKQVSIEDWGIYLPNDFAVKVKKVIQLTNESEITSIRNEQRGHGYINCHDTGYKTIFNECSPVIEEIEKLLSPLFHRFNYYYIMNATRKSGKVFSIRTYNLSGSNPAFIEEEIEISFDNIEDIPIESNSYLVSPDKKTWYNLHPYLRYGECNLCHHNRILIYDGKYVLDPYIGHRFDSSVLN